MTLTCTTQPFVMSIRSCLMDNLIKVGLAVIVLAFAVNVAIAFLL